MFMEFFSTAQADSDGILAEAVKVTMKAFLRVFKDIFQTILSAGQFPQLRKKLMLVLIAKPGKTAGEQSALRPLGLNYILPKALEIVILDCQTVCQGSAKTAPRLMPQGSVLGSTL